MTKELWANLKKRLTIPLFGLGAVSVSTVLAACYGPDPGEDNFRYTEYCEQILQSECKSDTDTMTAECQDCCTHLKEQQVYYNDIEIPEICPQSAQ